MKVGEAASKLKSIETTMGDVPEEFLDPILGNIINNPVILPNSQVTLDRTSTVRHLLRYVFTMIFTLIIFLLCSTVCSDATDPFTPVPLTMDQVVPNIEVKEQIEGYAWQNKLPTNN